MIERKRFSGLNRLCMLVLLSYFLVFPSSQAMGEWACPFIEASTSTEGNTLTYTINLTPLLPNEISTAYMTVDYDPEQLSFSDFNGLDFSECLIDYVQLDYHDQDIGEVYMTLYAFSPIPTTEDGCLFKMIFTEIGENVKSPFIKEIGEGEGDFCPDGECWCPTPMTCHINVIPTADTVYSEENIDFSTEILYCENPPSCEWNVECDSSIVPNDTDSCKALYTAGGPEFSCEDTVTVTETGNEYVKEEYSMATANVYINASVVINPKKPEPAGYPDIVSGTIVEFETDSSFCNSTTMNTWSVESNIGSEIGFKDSRYHAGYEFTDPDEAEVDIIKVNAVCPDDGVERSAKTSVTVTYVPPTTTTTTTKEIIHKCDTSADCDDGIFCNGAEICKFTWSSNLAGSTGGTGNQLVKECYPGTDPCPDDGEFCNGEESCDERNDVCLNSGDPCVDDGEFCNGEEICDEETDACVSEGDPCEDVDDGEFCNGEEICDEETDACVSEGDPCIDTESPVCDEEGDMCVPEPPLPNVLTEPDPVSQSRWIPLPVFLTITGQDGAIFDATSSVIFNPNAIWALPLIISEGEIIAMGLIMPQWLTGPIASEEDGDIDVTVITGSQEAPGTIEVQLLPFFLDEDKAILE